MKHNLKLERFILFYVETTKKSVLKPFLTPKTLSDSVIQNLNG